MARSVAPEQHAGNAGLAGLLPCTAQPLSAASSPSQTGQPAFVPQPAHAHRLAPAVVLAMVYDITDDAPRLAAAAMATRVGHTHDAACMVGEGEQGMGRGAGCLPACRGTAARLRVHQRWEVRGTPVGIWPRGPTGRACRAQSAQLGSHDAGHAGMQSVLLAVPGPRALLAGHLSSNAAPASRCFKLLTAGRAWQVHTHPGAQAWVPGRW